MPTTTTRLGLTKPLGTENIDISILNANADKIDSFINFSPVTSATRPAAPYNGQAIRETDTGKHYVHNGGVPASANWVQMLDGGHNLDLSSTVVITIGSGSSNLYRSAANVLKTDGSLVVATNATVSGSAAITGALSVGASATVAGSLAVTGNITGPYVPTIQSFTPTFSAGITAVGTGATVEGWYYTLGKVVVWGMRVEFGTSPACSNIVNMNLPVVAFTGGGTSFTATLGSWCHRVSASAAYYAGTTVVNDAGGVGASFAGCWNGTNPGARVGSGSTPMRTVAAGDIFSASGIYRAA